MTETRRDPFFGLTPEDIKSYITETPLKVGDKMIVYNGQGDTDRYYLAEVKELNIGRMKRVRLSKAAWWGGDLFYRTGKNCDSPTGQSKMIPPIPEIMNLLDGKDHYEESRW